MTANITVGAHVEGSYMGSKFTGIVRSYRQHTINYKVTLISVDLDEPLYIAAVDRLEPNGVLMHTSYDGRPLDPSAGDWSSPDDYVKVIDETA